MSDGSARVSALTRLRTRVTRRFYRTLYQLYRAAFPDDAPPAPLAPARVRRLLLARTDRVGDAVVLSPTVGYLRARLPHAEIDIVTASAASLLAGDARLDHVYVYERGARGWWRMVRTLRARRYDVVLTLRVLDHLDEGVTAGLVAPRGAARATVRRPPQYAGLFTQQVRVPRARRHITTRFLHLAWAAVGDPYEAPPALAEYPPWLPPNAAADARANAFIAGPLSGRAFVAFNAWGSEPKRCFGVARAAEIAAALAARRPELAIVLTPPPARAAEATAMAAAAAALDPGATARILIAPVSADLADLVALLRRAAVVLSPDTANMHIAAALGTPLVAVYTAYTEVTLWSAWGTMPRRIVHLAADQPIDAVPAREVVAAVDALCAEVAQATRAAPAAEAPNEDARIERVLTPRPASC